MSNPAPVVTRGAYAFSSAAIYLDTSEREICRLVAEGHLTAYLPRGMKRGRRILVEELDRYRLASAADAGNVVPIRGVAS